MHLATTTRKGDVRIPFEDLLDIMNFALENAIVVDFDGRLRRQIKGIPMGDPHSPGMTIGTCALMEHTWMDALTPDTKSNFLAKRYMDDILVFYAEREGFNHEKFIYERSSKNRSATYPHYDWRTEERTRSWKLPSK